MISQEDIQKAAQIIKHGGLVAFPTETVYGLGADVFQAEAVVKIFKAKGRPQSNPLISHIADLPQLDQLAINIPKIAYTLAEKFWPGPLTVVLQKHPNVPDIVTAGLETVTIRMPRHTIALELIRTANTPIAAPSANISGKPSSTNHTHVLKYFPNSIDCILPGGACEVGVESTVLDLTSETPTILRLGGLPVETLQQFIPELTTAQPTTEPTHAKSPGMLFRHYAPSGKIYTFSNQEELLMLLERHSKHSLGIMGFESLRTISEAHTKFFSLGNTIEEATSHLFAGLNTMDETNKAIILIQIFPDHGLGRTYNERVKRAAE